MSRDLRRGLWLGLAGVAMFALTLPMTRLAVGTAEAPLMSGVFVATGRAAVAAALSALFLLATRAPWPRRAGKKMPVRGTPPVPPAPFLSPSTEQR